MNPWLLSAILQGAGVLASSYGRIQQARQYDQQSSGPQYYQRPRYGNGYRRSYNRRSYQSGYRPYYRRQYNYGSYP